VDSEQVEMGDGCLVSYFETIPFSLPALENFLFTYSSAHERILCVICVIFQASGFREPTADCHGIYINRGLRRSRDRKEETKIYQNNYIHTHLPARNNRG